MKKTPETPQLDEHSHDHDAEDAALFASLLMAPGSAGHGLTVFLLNASSIFQWVVPNMDTQVDTEFTNTRRLIRRWLKWVTPVVGLNHMLACRVLFAYSA